MHLLKILFLLVLSVSLAHAKPILGHDTLAILHPKFSDHNQLPKNTALGVLHWTFGSETDLLKSYLDQVEPQIVRVHLINTTCIRNQNCGKYEIGYGYTIETFDSAVQNKEKNILAFVTRATKIYEELSSYYPKTKFLVSPALEHNLSRTSFRILADSVLSVWPGVQLVNSPMDTSRAERYRGAWLEGHGKAFDPSVEITSLDGDDGFDTNIPDWKVRAKNTKIRFFWWKGLNCRTNSPVWEDPRSRTHCPKSQDMEAAVHITDVKPKPPKFLGTQCKRVALFDAPATNKPMAENKGTNDPRADKPVAILKFPLIDINIRSFKGQLVGVLAAYGAYQNGLNRFYSGYKNGSGLTGYEFEKIAVKKSGNPWVWLQSGSTCTGPLLMSRRAGTFR